MLFILGPCVIESEKNVYKIAKELEQYSNDERIDFFFKASFDKANRTSLDSFRGLGIDEGLSILQKIKDDFGYKILTDIHEQYQAQKVSEVADVLQIPAFLCRQTDLLVSAAKTDAIINIKKGQFISGVDMQYSALKVLKTRGYEKANYNNSKDAKLFLCERGNSFGYGNLVVDMKNLVTMKEFAPVIFDATHSVQMPGLGSGKTIGNRDMVPHLAKSAAAVGVDGFFIETHFNPNEALSDGANMMELSKLKPLVDILLKIEEAIK